LFSKHNKNKGYGKDDAIGEAEKPFCDGGEAKDGDFLNSGLKDF
jgi:hypothetical protein